MPPPMSNPAILQFNLTLTGLQLRTAITRRVGDLEKEIGIELEKEHALRKLPDYQPMRRYDHRNADELRSQQRSLVFIEMHLVADQVYYLTLVDLARMDLIGVVDKES